MDDELQIRALTIRRLRELEKQAAQYGPHTDPSVLIEIQDIYTQYPDAKRPAKRDNSALDFELLMNSVAAALQRITAIEEDKRADNKKRITRQLIHDIWMIAITVIAFTTLLLVLTR